MDANVKEGKEGNEGKEGGQHTDSTISEKDLDRLIVVAKEVKTQAYAPYSKFRVGAALLAASGQIYSGANVENCSYSLCICAERTAIAKAVTTGERSFQAVVVTTDVATDFTYPCGACRQVLSEFGDMDVYCVKPSGEVSRIKLSSLLPFAFNKASLDSCPGATRGGVS